MKRVRYAQIANKKSEQKLDLDKDQLQLNFLKMMMVFRPICALLYKLAFKAVTLTSRKY